MGANRNPLRPPLPQIGVRNPNLKRQSLLSQEQIKLRSSWTPQFFWVPAIISGTGKIRTSNLAITFRVHPNKSPSKNLEERERVVSKDWSFLVPPIISGMGKATNSNFVRTFIGSIGRVRAQGLSKNSAAGIKLRTSNLVGTFISDIRDKGAWARDWPIFRYPIIQERVKLYELQSSNLVPVEQKPTKHFRKSRLRLRSHGLRFVYFIIRKKFIPKSRMRRV